MGTQTDESKVELNIVWILADLHRRGGEAECPWEAEEYMIIVEVEERSE